MWKKIKLDSTSSSPENHLFQRRPLLWFGQPFPPPLVCFDPRSRVDPMLHLRGGLGDGPGLKL